MDQVEGMEKPPMFKKPYVVETVEELSVPVLSFP